jgi:EmrB/QacA subfamily drug resistance transporter
VSGSRRTGPILAIVLASYMMIVVDISIVITALPKMHESLGLSTAALSWVQNAYLLAFGGLLLLGARAGDVLGRRRIFMVGVGLFAFASLAVGLAQSSAWLLTGRALQGVGAAILAPSTLAFLQTCFEEGRERTRAVALYGAVAGIAAALGLVVGGLLTSWPSWRAGFFVNVPIGAALILASPRFLPETKRRPGRLDIVGALTSTIGMTLLVYGIVRSASAGWGDSITIASLLIAVALLAFFVAEQRRAAQPIMPLRLFASRERVGAYLARFLFLAGMVPFWFFATQYLQIVKGFSPYQAGLAFLPVTLPNFASAMAVPRLTRRFGNARLLVGGLVISVIGMAWLGQVSASSSYLFGVALPMVLIGIGQGGCLAPLTSAGIAGVPSNDAGAAGGVVNVAHQIGGSFGLGVLVAVFTAADGGFAHAIAVSLTVAAGILALALFATVALIVRPSRPPVAARAASGSALPQVPTPEPVTAQDD